ncbi:MAG: serine/threonine protein kinase, partial [Thermoanaerobaculia bacterium]|nr:serine/threonine protein kinase [Thermoanaerobaculia bacterium]
MELSTAVPIGRGASGQVYRVRHPELGFDVALKVLHFTDPELTARMLREARVQSSVDHPGVARVFETGELADGRPWIAMELVDGPTLGQLGPSLALEDRIRVVRQIAEALHASHAIGLIHRDVKPSNIILREVAGGWQPVLVDFGLAREVSISGPTLTGQALGTPGYMAPEQIAGASSELDCRADVYGLGVVLYELLAGRLPFSGTTSLDILVEQAGGRVLPLRRAQPNLPTGLVAIVDSCLDSDRDRRYP